MASSTTNTSKPPFITFEGGEGTGKSTQIRLLSERLQDLGLTVLSTREPGGSLGAEDIRQLLVTGAADRWTPLTEALLNNGARQEHLAQTIRPALAKGHWVLCDRFADSTLAYQGYAGGVALDRLKQLELMIVGEDQPDLTIVLDLDPVEGLRRAGERGDPEDRYEKKGLPYHQDIRAAFLAIAQDQPERCKVIDAGQEIEAIADQIWDVVREKFALPLGEVR